MMIRHGAPLRARTNEVSRFEDKSRVLTDSYIHEIGPKIAPPVDFARARRISSVSSASSVRSMTPVPMSRQSTPAAALQVPSKAFGPTPVASGPRAMSGYSTSRSASPFDRSADFASDFDESFVEEIEAVTVSVRKYASQEHHLLILGNVVS